MGIFRWISTESIFDAVDLRRTGWTLAEAETASEETVALVDGAGMDTRDLSRRLNGTREDTRAFMIVSGVNATEERARLLQYGFGDVVGDETSIVELDARARRLTALHTWLPRQRSVATLKLDLLARDALCAERWLGLNPREFALFWRLADSPGEIVTKLELVKDVCHLEFVPESNSIAVHMSRLRGKLGAIGLPTLLESANGGYRLRTGAFEVGRPSNWLFRTPTPEFESCGSQSVAS